MDDIIPYEYPEAVAQFLQRLDDTIASNTEQDKIALILSTLSDMFSMDVPTIGSDTHAVVASIARDTKLSNLIRERAYYRLFLLIRTTKPGPGGTSIPMWHGTRNDMGEMLQTQEDFIGWLTSKSGLSRASTFRRVHVYMRLQALGITGQDAWLRVLQMPSIMQELVSVVAVWERNSFKGVNDSLAIALADKVLPSQRMALEAAIVNGTTEDILTAYAPVVRAFFQEVQTYPNAKTAMDHVKRDILGTPTVSYRWSPDEQVILATVITPVIDKSGLVLDNQREIAIFIDDAEPPEALMADIFKRLPITNRHELPLT